MKNNPLNNNEIQDSVFSGQLKEALLSVLNNNFFSRLEDQSVSFEGYRFFVKEKYSSISYFLDFLERAEHLVEPLSHDLAKVFRDNRLDEIGCFAGEVRNEYAHETWRLRSLKKFNIVKNDLQDDPLFKTTKEHNRLMVELSKSEDVYEMIGGLLFLEIFVVYEMKNFIHAFERDVPEIFPKGEYSYDRMPFNTHEYWYGHALHDTWHYRSIEEVVLQLLEKEDISEEKLSSLVRGIEKVAQAKNTLYSPELIEAMLAR
jgi:hypothetical protein